MPYLDPSQDPSLNPDDNKSQAEVAQQGQSSNQSTQPDNTPVPPTTGAGGAGVVSGGGVSNSATPNSTTSKPSSSGSWTNLDSYLNANADQGSSVGNAIANTVNTQGTAAKKDLDTFNNDFNSQVSANTINSDQDAVSNAISAATSGNLSPDQVSAFQKQANASYSGPSDPTANQYFGQTQNDVNRAVQTANQTQSEAGRNVLLSNQYQNASVNGYNQGENNLDQMLLENSRGGQQALQPLAQQWGGLSNALSRAVADGQTAAKNAQATNQATAQNAQGALSSANTDFQTKLTNEVTNAQKQYQSNYDGLRNSIAAAQAQGLSGTEGLDSNTLSQLGLDSGAHLWGVDLNSYLNPISPSQYSSQTVATPQEYAEYNALNQLAGTTPTELINPSLAGTAPTSSINATKLAADLAAKQANYDHAFNNQQLSIAPYGYFGLTDDGSATQSLTAAQMQHYIQTLPTGNRYSPQDIAYWLPKLQDTLANFQSQNNWNNIISATAPVGR